MYLIKKVGRRTEGLGFKLIKFHGILHITRDMLNFGVPKEVNTEHNEDHHKPAKGAAKLTQKKKELFNIQTATRLLELDLLDYAMAELDGNAPWHYYEGYISDPVVEESEPKPATRGSTYSINRDQEGKPFIADTRNCGPKKRRVMIEQDFVEFASGLQDVVHGHLNSRFFIRTVHDRNGHKFRGTASFMDSQWRDWAVFDWGRDWGKLPCKIWGFVDLSALEDDIGLSYADCALTKGVYAIVESSVLLDDPDGGLGSDLLRPIETTVDGMVRNGFVNKLRFYLADVDAIVEPAVIIPDIGGPRNRYWWLKSCSEWDKLFVKWLEDPHNLDIMSDDESSDDEEDGSDSEEDGTESDHDNSSSATDEEETCAETEASDSAEESGSSSEAEDGSDEEELTGTEDDQSE
jgi:hypothetical protein